MPARLVAKWGVTGFKAGFLVVRFSDLSQPMKAVRFTLDSAMKSSSDVSLECTICPVNLQTAVEGSSTMCSVVSRKLITVQLVLVPGKEVMESSTTSITCFSTLDTL